MQTLQYEELVLTLGKIIRGGLGRVMGDRSALSVDNKKLLYMDANILYGHSMSQVLPYEEIEMWNDHPDLFMNKLEEILKTPDDSDFGNFNEVVLKYPDETKGKTRSFPFRPECKICKKIEFNDYMKNIKPDSHTQKKVNL